MRDVLILTLFFLSIVLSVVSLCLWFSDGPMRCVQ